VLKLIPTTNGPMRLLCIGAHSDDLEIGCGGTVLELLSRPGLRLDVSWVVLSGHGPRESEALASARRFLRKAYRSSVRIEKFRDGYLPTQHRELKEYFESLKSLAPDMLLCHTRHDLHQDHRLVAELCWNTFRDHWILEYEIPKYDGDLGAPAVFVPLSRANAHRKVRLLMQGFGTQRSKRWFTEDTFLGLMRLRGVECNAPSGYAEAFYARKTVI
jgi:LmbE family N-acetylglucosaminyl deacetylase